MIQARNCRVTSLTCVSGKVLKTIIKNGTPLYLKDYLIGSNQQFLHRKIMSQSISISGHVKLTDKQEQVRERMWTFKEPLERCPRLPNSLLSMKSKHCRRPKPAKTLNKIWTQHSSLQSANWIMKINSSLQSAQSYWSPDTGDQKLLGTQTTGLQLLHSVPVQSKVHTNPRSPSCRTILILKPNRLNLPSLVSSCSTSFHIP